VRLSPEFASAAANPAEWFNVVRYLRSCSAGECWSGAGIRIQYWSDWLISI